MSWSALKWTTGDSALTTEFEVFISPLRLRLFGAVLGVKNPVREAVLSHFALNPNNLENTLYLLPVFLTRGLKEGQEQRTPLDLMVALFSNSVRRLGYTHS